MVSIIVRSRWSAQCGSLPSDEESGLLTEGHAAVGLDDALVPTCVLSVYH
jgi:hypothetical protein